MSRQEDYGYAVARIRAMEHRLLDSAALQRMIDAEDTAAVLKILGETSYSSVLTANAGEADFDKILESELRATYAEVRSFTPDKQLVDLMLLSYDFHNVKVLLKSIFNVRGGGKKRWDLLSSLGAYPVDDLITHIDTEDYVLLPYGLNLLVPKCIGVWEQNGDVLEVERLLDERLFDVMLEEAKNLAVTGVVDWVRVRIDGENIRTLVRLKRFGFESAKALTFLHAGGTIDTEFLASMISEPFDSWGRMLDFSDIGKVLASIEFTGEFSELILSLEKALDDFYMEKLAASRYSPNAPENIPAYLWAKEMEVKNVRMIFVSKNSGGDKEQWRRLLRHGYE